MSRKKNPSREKPQKWESSKTDKDITSREYNNIITSKLREYQELSDEEEKEL